MIPANMLQAKLKTAMYLAAPLCAALFIVLQASVFKTELSLFEYLRLTAVILFTHVIAVGDLFTKKIPNKVILAMLTVFLMICAAALFFDTEAVLRFLPQAGIGALSSGGLFLLVYAVSRHGLGGGDVKFITVAGLYLTMYYALPAMLIGSIAAGLLGLTLLALKRASRKTAFPLIPFIYAGMLVSLCLNGWAV